METRLIAAVNRYRSRCPRPRPGAVGGIACPDRLPGLRPAAATQLVHLRCRAVDDAHHPAVRVEGLLARWALMPMTTVVLPHPGGPKIRGTAPTPVVEPVVPHTQPPARSAPNRSTSGCGTARIADAGVVPIPASSAPSTAAKRQYPTTCACRTARSRSRAPWRPGAARRTSRLPPGGAGSS
jgi:hypothetical protein